MINFHQESVLLGSCSGTTRPPECNFGAVSSGGDRGLRAFGVTPSRYRLPSTQSPCKPTGYPPPSLSIHRILMLRDRLASRAKKLETGVHTAPEAVWSADSRDLIALDRPTAQALCTGVSVR